MYKLLTFAIALAALQLIAPANALNCNIKPGDSRLSTFCVINNIPPNATLTQEQFVGLSSRLYGVGQPPLIEPDSPLLEGGYDRYSGNFYPFPVLDYIENLNGGNPTEDQFLRPFVQEDERQLAKKGVVIGAGVGYSGKFIIREGSYLNFGTNGQYSYNPAHKLPLINSRGNTCIVNHIRNWWYLDPCANVGYSKKRLSKSASSNFSLSLSKYFASNPQTYHNAKVGLNYFITDDLNETSKSPSDYQQRQIQFNFDTIYSADFYTSLALTLGENVKKDKSQFDKNFDRPGSVPVLKRNISATIGTLFFDRPISLTLSFNDTDAISVLGSPRYDRTSTAFLSYSPFNSLNLGIGYRKTDSTWGTDYFDSGDLIYSFNYTPFFF